MPEELIPAVMVGGKALRPGTTFEMGVLRSSVEEIIAFARVADPLPLHLDLDAAKNSIFGGLVAPGAQFYVEFYKRWFVPQLGGSVLCGLGINNWNFIQPHLPELPYTGRITVLALSPKPEKGNCRVTWKYTFHAPDGSLAQEMEVRVLHRLDP